ncbi:MAG: GNAT family N-acetyltransferase [Elainellaceae cyanobacterium]
MTFEETVSYFPMSLERHGPQSVADLIYQAAPSLFSAMFGPRHRAVACIAALVERSHGQFSHRYIHIAETAQRIVGMVTLVPAEQLQDAAAYATLGPLQRLWLNLLNRFLLRHLLRHDYPANAFYIGNLAVAPEYRNRGIGRQLLSQCIADAGTADLFISVDVDNPRAQKLYESLGFQVIGAKTIRLLNSTLGSRILLRSPLRVYIRKPTAGDLQALLSLRQRSREFHAPWVFLPQSEQDCKAYVERCRSDAFEGLLICRLEDNAIVGVVNLGQIFYGPFQNAYVSYYADVAFAGRGLMSEGVGLALKHAFNTLKLHRLEANIQPGNVASINLVKRLGFTQEGFSRRYLNIDGQWRDHERWALTMENWKPLAPKTTET